MPLPFLHRDVVIVNLDPANENVPYDVDVDINNLISLQVFPRGFRVFAQCQLHHSQMRAAQDCMEELDLGPNGGLIYCMEYLAKNMEWLREQLKPHEKKYIIFDLPGQVELNTHHEGMRSIVDQLKKWDFRLCAVHLVDAHHCSDPAKFISVMMVALSAMVHLELPTVNILSKIDVIELYGPLAFGLEFYTNGGDLSYLLDYLDQDPFAKRYRKLNEELVELVNNWSLVSFIPLNISVSAVLVFLVPHRILCTPLSH